MESVNTQKKIIAQWLWENFCIHIHYSKRSLAEMEEIKAKGIALRSEKIKK